MDHISILKNAFQTTLRYRAMWVLGLLWALVGGGLSWGTAGNPNGGGSGYVMDEGDLSRLGIDVSTIFGLIILACGLLLVIILVTTVLRYVLQSGVYQVLADLEQESINPSVRRGFRLGWNRRTWRLFFQNWLIGLPFAIVVMLLLLLVASPLLLLIADNDFATALAILGTVGLFIAWLALVIVSASAIGVLSEFWWRAAAIDDLGTIEAIRRGWTLLRSNLSDVLIMWLLMIGIGILVFAITIPLFIIFLVVAGLAVGVPSYLIFEATSSLWFAALWFIPIGFLVFVLPLAFASGLYLIFQASVWNQMYLQLRQRLEAGEVPA